MSPRLTRRGFCAASATALLVPLGAVRGGTGDPGVPTDLLGESFPVTDPSRAREIVGASHRDIDKVRALLVEDRSLALATWDWGFGDWETALGAASHTGRREIAELLMAHGARADLFTLAMLDRVDAVRAVCEAIPGIQRTRGPHGITLLQHAKNGEAARVEEYLAGLGGADELETMLEAPDPAANPYLGEYAWESAEEIRFVVRANRTGLGIERAGGSFRPLRRTGEHAFSPSGSPHVTIRFTVTADRAKGLTIERATPLLTARRVG